MQPACWRHSPILPPHSRPPCLPSTADCRLLAAGMQPAPRRQVERREAREKKRKARKARRLTKVTNVHLRHLLEGEGPLNIETA